MEKNVTINQGWECPKCGSVYSPLTSKCSICPQGTITSSGTNITITQGKANFTTTYGNHNFIGDGTHCTLCGINKLSHFSISIT